MLFTLPTACMKFAKHIYLSQGVPNLFLHKESAFRILVIVFTLN